MNPLPFIESKLEHFRHCFRRTAAFRWFVAVVVAFMIREDHLGVTSFVRALGLEDRCYVPLLNFFRSDAVCDTLLQEELYQILIEDGHLLKIQGRNLLVGDGVKVSKEGRFMPGVKRLHQESADSSKAEWIMGSLYGGLSAIVSNGTACFATPLSLTVQDGLSEASSWESAGVSGDSHVVQMLHQAMDAARHLGPSYVALDRYFLSAPAIRCLGENSDEEPLLHIVTRAKSNCIAYEMPLREDKPHRGRPRKRGDAVQLISLFTSRAEDFLTASASIYGKTVAVRYLCLDLLWGVKLYRKLRFVLTVMDGVRSIFVTTDLTLDPMRVLEIYGFRFKIETSFRAMKQDIGTFGYHFWTHAIPKRSHFQRREEPSPLSKVQSDADRRRVLLAIRATHRFVRCACIAMTLLHMLALNMDFSDEIASSRFLRTPSPHKPSEGTVITWLRRNLFRFLLGAPHSSITRFIQPLMTSASDTSRPSIAA